VSGEYAYLPCNGLDKPEGPLAREVALQMLAATGGELVCPVLLGRSQARYAKVLEELPLFAIDGCATRCASRLAADHGLVVARKVQLSEVLKATKSDVEDSPRPGPRGLAFVQATVSRLLAQPGGGAAAEATGEGADFAGTVEYLALTHDKFIFRVPKEGYYFDENDCWARVSGKRARIGISDFMQQTLTDILFCTPAGVGSDVARFGEAGTVESSKATFEVVSPVSGRVVAVNQAVLEAPELVNEDPYERGWIVELELADFAAERELLLDGPQYLEHLRQKAAEYRM
jgi:glycine cleavage system H protein